MVAHGRGGGEKGRQESGSGRHEERGGEGRRGAGVQVNEDCGVWISYGAGSTRQGGRSGNEGTRKEEEDDNGENETKIKNKIEETKE